MNIPTLLNALCRNHLDVFDDETPEGIADAVALCHRCPELEPCRRWSERLGPAKFTGVIAGKQYIHKNRRNTA